MSKKTGSKLLVCGLERIGKSTLTAQLDEALVVVMDEKQYGFPVPHYKPASYAGIDAFKAELITKLKAYKEKYGKAPRTVVFDTITQHYNNVYKWAQDNYRGFDQHNAVNSDTLAFNIMIESLLIKNGVNVVIVAHVLFDESTQRYIIPATGNFAKTGSWLSVVDESTYMFHQNNQLWVAHNLMKYPSRSTLKDLPAEELLETYDINKHLGMIEEKQAGNSEFTL